MNINIKKQTKEIVVKENETYFVKFTLNEEINELKEIRYNESDYFWIKTIEPL